MKLYIKQKVFSFRDRFTVKDEHGIDMFQIMGEIFSFGKVLHICDMNECRLLTIRQKLFTLMPRFEIERDGNVIAEIAKDFSMKESNVTMHLLRTRKKLEQFLKKEGFDL